MLLLSALVGVLREDGDGSGRLVVHVGFVRLLLVLRVLPRASSTERSGHWVATGSIELDALLLLGGLREGYVAGGGLVGERGLLARVHVVEAAGGELLLERGHLGAHVQGRLLLLLHELLDRQVLDVGLPARMLPRVSGCCAALHLSSGRLPHVRDAVLGGESARDCWPSIDYLPALLRNELVATDLLLVVEAVGELLKEISSCSFLYSLSSLSHK